MNSVRFEDPHDHINPIYNKHDETHIIDIKEQNRDFDEAEQEEVLEDTNKNTIVE